MSRYRVAIHVVPRRGLLDPQGKAVADALNTLGFGGVSGVRVGRHLVLDLEAKSEAEARTLSQQMCEKLLANPVTEDFEIAAVASA
jgi:phosphoribosylformylglycinamidine synthase subunit PurS